MPSAFKSVPCVTGPKERALFDAGTAEEVVAGFAATIGDVDLTLAAEKRDFDPLLYRDGPAS